MTLQVNCYTNRRTETGVVVDFVLMTPFLFSLILGCIRPNITDRWTDGRVDRRTTYCGITAFCVASRGKKTQTWCSQYAAGPQRPITIDRCVTFGHHALVSSVWPVTLIGSTQPWSRHQWHRLSFELHHGKLLTVKHQTSSHWQSLWHYM